MAWESFKRDTKEGPQSRVSRIWTASFASVIACSDECMSRNGEEESIRGFFYSCQRDSRVMYCTTWKLAKTQEKAALNTEMIAERRWKENSRGVFTQSNQVKWSCGSLVVAKPRKHHSQRDLKTRRTILMSVSQALLPSLTSMLWCGLHCSADLGMQLQVKLFRTSWQWVNIERNCRHSQYEQVIYKALQNRFSSDEAEVLSTLRTWTF